MTKREIKLLCDIAWQEKFLELAGHKVGDEVRCHFPTYHGNSKQSFMSSSVGPGIIVKTEKGFFIKSKETYPTAHSEKRRPYDRNSYWVYRDEYVITGLENMFLD